MVSRVASSSLPFRRTFLPFGHFLGRSAGSFLGKEQPVYIFFPSLFVLIFFEFVNLNRLLTVLRKFTLGLGLLLIYLLLVFFVRLYDSSCLVEVNLGSHNP